MLTKRQTKVIELLNIDLGKINQRGWITGVKCPFCGSDSKFGVRLNTEKDRKNDVSFNCFRGKCGAHGTEYHILKQFNSLHIFFEGEFIGNKERVEKAINDQQNRIIDIEAIDRSIPLGFKRINHHPYLQSRGFEEWQYEAYSIGQTKLITKLRDYVIFLIKEEGKNKGYVSRLTWSDKKVVDYRQTTGLEPLRYLNESVEFSKLLFGIDEISNDTHTIILVEGITDKANVDRLLKLNASNEMKCLATFGKKMSIEQIMKLKFKGSCIHKIIVLYDPDAINATKVVVNTLSDWFSEIIIGYLPNDKDPGDVSLKELLDTIENNTTSPINFNINYIQKRKLI